MYQVWVERMGAAASASERRAVVSEMCTMFAFSSAKAYKVLREAGWQSGRAKRKDAGATALDAELLLAVADMTKQALRKNVKATLPVNVARSILLARGFDIPVGDARLRALLRENHLAIEDFKTAAAHQEMRSLYPNQVHFADPSVALLYFAPGGKQKIIGDDELYKNKNYLEGKLKCWRYVLTDHYSASICVRYYAAMGETAVNMYDFLLYAWGQKRSDAFVFHGLPEILIWDCGSANTSHAVSRALAAFGVRTLPHLPGNPRAKGQVETSNNIVETQFESRLRFEPVSSVEELNDAAERWCAAYNANLLKGQDTRLKRGGMVIGSRAELWLRIKNEQLRELPEEDVCRQVFSSGTQTRKVDGALCISFVHPAAPHSMRYSLRDCDGVYVGQEVTVLPVLLGGGFKCVVSYEYDKRECSYEVAPIEVDDAGFNVAAAVFGQEYKRKRGTPVDKLNKEIDDRGIAAVAGPAHSYIKPESDALKRRDGTRIEVPDTVRTYEILISATEAAKRVKAQLGYLPEGFLQDVRKQYPEGVPANLVDIFVMEEREAVRDDYIEVQNNDAQSYALRKVA